MIFQRALQRELINTAGAVFTVLFTVVITLMLIKILGHAAKGRIASADVVALIGFAALRYLPNILILTGFISVLLVITRSYRDFEMVVWFSSGLSLLEWIKPVLRFGLPLVVLTAVLSFFLTPWATRESSEYEQRFAQREDIARVTPGKFMESSSSDRIFFVEGISGDATRVQNIFVNSTQNGKTSVIVAKEGAVELHGNDKFVVMQKGRRYDGAAGQSDFQLMEFEQYGMRISSQARALEANRSSPALSTSALMKDPNRFNLGALLWRIALPLICLFLILLAIPLSFANPRVGRSANLMIALLLYMTYTNISSIFQTMVEQERLSFGMAWWPMHVAALLTIVLLFAWRLNVNSRYHPLGIWNSFKQRLK